MADGGYGYCPNFMNKTKAMINLGIGSEGNDLFGCDIVKRHWIPNFQYDCSGDKKPTC